MSITHRQLMQELRQSVIYEVNIRQYTPEGTFRAFSEHLPRLKSMGVSIIWLMPIHPIGIINRKGTLGSYYSISNHEDINPEFGTKEDFRELVAQVHHLGLKIIIDWVANHAAWDHVWTHEHPDFFVREISGEFHSPYDWTDVIQVDHKNTNAHDAMRAAMCYWVKEFDIDGFRADLAHLTPLEFWIQARQMTESIKPGLIWLAETEDAAFYQAFDIVYAWKWMHATEHFFKNDHNVHQLMHVLHEQNSPYPKEALQLYFTTNHDENSWNGTEFEKYGDHAEQLAVFSFFFPSSVPLIYSGQEIPNNKRLAFFEKDTLHWPKHPGMEFFYTKLASLRQRLPLHTSCHFLNLGDKILAFRLDHEQLVLYVMLNLSEAEANVEFEDSLANGDFIEWMTNETTSLSGSVTILLPRAGYRIFLKQ